MIRSAPPCSTHCLIAAISELDNADANSLPDCAASAFAMTMMLAPASVAVENSNFDGSRRKPSRRTEQQRATETLGLPCRVAQCPFRLPVVKIFSKSLDVASGQTAAEAPFIRPNNASPCLRVLTDMPTKTSSSSFSN
jgi:hypothetical protein